MSSLTRRTFRRPVRSRPVTVMPSMLSRSGLGWGSLAVAPRRAVGDVGEQRLLHHPDAALPGEVLDAAGVRGVARVGQVEADGVADARGEAALQDEELPSGVACTSGTPSPASMRYAYCAASRKWSPLVRVQVWKRTRSALSPAIGSSMDARRVWPPGSRVRPSKVWLEVARPAGATSRRTARGAGRGSCRRGSSGGWRLDLGGDEPSAVAVDDEALGVEVGAVLVREVDGGLRLERAGVQVEQLGPVLQGGERSVAVHGEGGEVADEGAVVRRLVERVGEAVDRDGGRTGVARARVGAEEGGGLGRGGPGGGQCGGGRQVAVTVAMTCLRRMVDHRSGDSTTRGRLCVDFVLKACGYCAGVATNASLGLLVGT